MADNTPPTNVEQLTARVRRTHHVLTEHRKAAREAARRARKRLQDELKRESEQQ